MSWSILYKKWKLVSSLVAAPLFHWIQWINGVTIFCYLTLMNFSSPVFQIRPRTHFSIELIHLIRARSHHPVLRRPTSRHPLADSTLIILNNLFFINLLCQIYSIFLPFAFLLTLSVPHAPVIFHFIIYQSIFHLENT